jgi:hypothetical protein
MSNRPPKLWFYKNFAVLFAVALMPYFWWVQIYLTFSAYWQDHLHWSSIIAGVKLYVHPITHIHAHPNLVMFQFASWNRCRTYHG